MCLLCVSSAPGAFLVPYFVMVLVIGLPIFFAELFVGQYSGLGPIKAYGRLAPFFQGKRIWRVVCTYAHVLCCISNCAAHLYCTNRHRVICTNGELLSNHYGFVHSFFGTGRQTWLLICAISTGGILRRAMGCHILGVILYR